MPPSATCDLSHSDRAIHPDQRAPVDVTYARSRLLSEPGQKQRVVDRGCVVETDPETEQQFRQPRCPRKIGVQPGDDARAVLPEGATLRGALGRSAKSALDLTEVRFHERTVAWEARQ